MHAGNILNIKTYAYNKPSNEDLNSFKKIDEFTYTCTGWKDQLIDFNGKQIAYDSMGRPTTYKNMEFKWNTLNQLEEIPELNVKYEYDSLGIRNKKVINGSETKIITEGTKILKVINDKYKIIFTYSLNKLIGFIYTKDGISKEYIYIRNIQGDIKTICDNNGEIVASYEYNAYGNCIITENIDDIANINPFRYRGYYYDEETGLYYLNSRYYDPETGRFISPDTLSILDETKGQINGLNLYMYCGDNPVMRVDPTGHFWDWIFDIVSIAWSLYDFIKNPSWENAGWLALDVVLGVIPFVPAIGKGIKGFSKIDDLVDIGKGLNHLDDVHDAIVIGNGMDRVKDAARLYDAVYYGGYKPLNALADAGKIADASAKMKILARVDNAKWLFKNIFAGAKIIDIGKDSRNIFKWFISAYGMERRLLFYWWHGGHAITRLIRLF